MARPLIIVTGDKELDANLQSLSGAAATRASVSALRAGLRELARADKRLAPVGRTGAVRASIGSRVMRRAAAAIMGKAGINVGGAGRKRLNVINQGSGGAGGGGRARRIMAGLTTKGRGKKARAQFMAGNRGTAPHSHLVALGTKARYTTGKTTQHVWSQKALRWTSKVASNKPGYRGVMPRNDFIRRAFSQAANSVRFVMRAALAAAIGREVNKFGRKTGRAYSGVI